MTHDVTADFIDLRLHGERGALCERLCRQSRSTMGPAYRRLARGSESPPRSRCALARREEGLRRKARDIYCYFDNTT